MFVDLVLKGQSQAPAAAAAQPRAADGVLTHDTSGLYPLVLWMQLLVVAVLVGLWAGAKWGIWQTWIAAGPVVLAALWASTTEVWLLLPNLL